MRLPRGVTLKRRSYFLRVHSKGGEESFALGRRPEDLATKVDLIRAALRKGRTPGEVRADLRQDRNPLGPKGEPQPQALPEPEATVADAARRWIAEWVEPELKPENASCIKSRVHGLLLPFLGARPIRSLRRPDCFAYKGYLRHTRPDLKPGTLLHYLRDLRELLNWAVDVELLDSSPWPQPSRSRKKSTIMPRLEKKPPDRLSDKEMEAVIALPDPWGFNLRLALSTGFRWGELVRLERTDLTSDGLLLIRKSKSGKPRIVPIPRSLLPGIMSRRGRLFVTRTGRPYSDSSNGAFNATIVRMTGIDRFHVHMTRHTFACRYLEAGGELAMLQEILGHSSVTTTQRYGRPNEKAIRADAARVFSAWEAPDREQYREHRQNGAEAAPPQKR